MIQRIKMYEVDESDDNPFLSSLRSTWKLINASNAFRIHLRRRECGLWGADDVNWNVNHPTALNIMIPCVLSWRWWIDRDLASACYVLPCFPLPFASLHVQVHSW